MKLIEKMAKEHSYNGTYAVDDLEDAFIAGFHASRNMAAKIAADLMILLNPSLNSTEYRMGIMLIDAYSKKCKDLGEEEVKDE